MILSNVNIGTGPSSGDGDPLRSAFSTINNNFQKITNNVNALSNSVTSVAGRNGNVVLTVNDVIGAASKAYVDAAVGNVIINGNITLTNGSTIQDGLANIVPAYSNVAVQVTAIDLKPAGANENQLLRIYPTVGEGNHLHLTTGDLTSEYILLGDDDHYVEVNAWGINIGTNGGAYDNDNPGNVWNFNDSGTFQLAAGTGGFVSYLQNTADGTLLWVNSKEYTFGLDGNLKLPANGGIVDSNGNSVLGGGGGSSFSTITLTDSPPSASNTIKNGLGNIAVENDGGWTIGAWDGTTWGTEGIRINPGIEGSAGINLPSDSTANVNPVQISNYAGNVEIYSYAHYWTFGRYGQTIFPILFTQRGDNPSGTISGYTLNIGDGTNEAVITTPDGNGAYQNSQRLVINPGAGADGTAGEGGDIYLWAGRGGTGDGTTGGGSGGDIKIRGGQGMAQNAGGYIRMEAGDSHNDTGQAGYIEITAGQTTGGSTGYVAIRGGRNNDGQGGPVALYGGYGTTGYGNIVVQSNTNYWTFDNRGNLTLPIGGDILDSNGASVLGGSGSNYGNSNVAAYLPTYTGNVGATAVTGTGSSVEIVAGSSMWTFANTGNLQLPIGGAIVDINGIILSGNAPTYANTTPTPTSVGYKGDIVQNGSYIYFCIAANTWVRSSITTSW